MDGRVECFDTTAKDLRRFSDIAHIARIRPCITMRNAYLIGNPASLTMEAVPPDP
jgi:hypothetical protein